MLTAERIDDETLIELIEFRRDSAKYHAEQGHKHQAMLHDLVLNALLELQEYRKAAGEPALYASEETLLYAKRGELHLRCLSEPMGDAVIPLYRHAQPAPAVESVQNFSISSKFTPRVIAPDTLTIPEPATLTNINQLCPLDLNVSQTDFATGWNDCRNYALTNGELPPIIKGIHAVAQGWNACRAAMQQPVSNRDEFPGWVKCSERMPEGMQTVITSNGGDIGHGWWDGDAWQEWSRHDAVPGEISHWMPLPAAPQQEPQ